jgi:hypothetical protein
MGAPFAQSWAFLKAEAYINMNSDVHNQTIVPQVEGGMHSPKGTFISSLPRYQQPRPDGPNYRRGGSVPRNWDEKHGNQRFTGVNVANQWQHLRDENPTVDEEELQDSFADKFATASAHEDVHGLTDAEIGTWAAHAVGGFPANLAATNFSVPKNRVKDWKTLRDMAHEYGAYSLTEPEAKKRKMEYYHFAPYLTGEKDISELHSGSR